MNIAVFVSGSGTNLQAIIDAVKAGKIKAKISLVVSDNEKAYALTRAKDADIETFVLKPKKFREEHGLAKDEKFREEYDKRIAEELEKRDVGLVVLAGFMRLMSPYFVRKFKNKIINIHPALLPSFKGTQGIKDALKYGVKVTGPTVHFVDEELDHGPIILQAPVIIDNNDTEEELAAKVHKEEHKIYPEAVRLFVEGKLKVENRKVRIA
jgi:phosphoribosylglycinamide formyltransferase-1